MSLVAGTRLGPYEILSPIGSGGMGEVYRARDGRLGRDVAIKVLPSSFSADPDRLRRFEQEARAAGVLNHPNITAVYDVGASDGTAYVVQELLEGETLRARLASGPLPMRRAVEFAVQLAHGLAAAHARGIVHRDLKPENVFVTQSGHVKILDFGLARMTESEGEGTRSPTAVAATEPGTVMGTVGYMSPEQVRGRPADHRSDIFSFGAILYEMLSGRRAFAAESAAETMAAIAKEEPPELSKSNVNVSPGLDDVVRHCLEKNPADRFETANDLAFALQAVSGHSTPRSEPVAFPAKSRRTGVVAAAFLGGALVGIAALLAVRSRVGAGPPQFQRLTFDRGIVDAARFSADGHTIVYSAAWNGEKPAVFSTRSGASESRALGYPGAALLALSSSDELALSIRNVTDIDTYWSATIGTLGRVPLAGGEPREDLDGVVAADFSRDGATLAVVRQQAGRSRLEYPPGTVLYETAGWISFARISPAGDRVAFLDHSIIGGQAGGVAVVDRKGRKMRLTSGFVRAQGLAWSPGGDEVWFTATRSGSARALYAVTLSGKERVLLRVPGALTLFDVAKDGRVLLAEENLRKETYGREPGATAERDLSWLDYSAAQGISDDGTTFVFGEFGDASSTGETVYWRRTNGSAPVRLADGNPFAISSDGRSILAQNPGDPSSAGFVLLPTGPGQAKTFPMQQISCDLAAFHPDGKRLLLVGSRSNHPRQTFIMTLETGAIRVLTPEGTAPGQRDFGPAISRDGRFVAVRDKEGAVYLWPIDGGSPRPLPAVSSADDLVVSFSSDGRWLHLFRKIGSSGRISRIDLSTGESRPVLDLTPRDPAGVVSIDNVAIAPDGSAYVYSFARRLTDLYVVEGLK